MRISLFSRCALSSCVAGVMLAGCGASQPPIGAPDATSQTSAHITHVERGSSWMAPNAKASDLVYVSNFYSSDILVFRYPGGKAVGMLTGDEPQGECTSSTSKGNWWVVNSGSNEIVEYAHGGTSPISTLSETAGEAASCAVDPTTGNIATTVLDAGDVVVFAGGTGAGTTISDGMIETFFDAYDSKGNLFVDGLNGSGAFGLVEFLKGRSSFKTITLNETIQFPGALQWHERYLVVSNSNGLDRFRIHGTTGSLEGITMLDGGGDGGAFWIQRHHVAATSAGGAAIWKYPAGGEPIKTLGGSFDLPNGVVVSAAR
jgi:hypothetical protein